MWGNAAVRAVPELDHLQRTVLFSGAVVVLVGLVIDLAAVVVFGKPVGTPDIAIAVVAIATVLFILLRHPSLFGLAALISAGAALGAGFGDGAMAGVILPAQILAAAIFGVSRRGLPSVLGVGAAGVLSTASPLWTDGVDAGTAFSVGLISLFVGVLTLRVAEEQPRVEAGTLFDEAPVALMEQDWSLVESWIEDLRRSGVEDLAGLLEANPNLVSEAIAKASITRANRAALRVYGIKDPAGVLGPFRPDRVNDRSRERFTEHLLSLWRGEPLAPAEIQTYSFTGEPVRQRLNYQALPGAPGRLLVSATDIADLHEAYEALEEAMESRDRFVASVAHELRSPISTVLGFAHELTHRYQEFTEEERIEMLGLIAREARDVADIIEDLLVAARSDVGGVPLTIESLDLGEEIATVVSVTGVAVTVEEPPGRIMAIGDAMRVRQIIRNLVTNAGRYGGPDRVISFGIDGGTAFIEVADDGPEIPDEALETLFAPYTRPEHRPGVSGSVGLGLTVARSLAEAMQGSLRACRRGSRTVFRLELPAAPGR